ncbi:hypothetical protein QYE76_054563 [Lolium multiflorum]|uniref:Transposase (putative) gypsy type domain-containing protein n=1 Tax=Lolium multiflorum TaxID=4521 RepID=A0AAD8SZ32_LOLMU|nr:hypothetical protein QYE76_054563 [Lolium multiflorum]
MEKKLEEVAAKKSKARSRKGEVKGQWWPCTTTEDELRSLVAEGFLLPGSWRVVPGARSLTLEAGEWVLTRALVEHGFSLPPSDFFLEILGAYKLQPHNISPNSILAIANHVALCEGHLRVKPDLALFQFFFSVKQETVPQTSSLANCVSITFKIRPGRIYPHTDRHESVRFFYLKDVADPASPKTLSAFKDGPASETSAWTTCPDISESPALVRMVRQICKLAESGLLGKDLTLSWFTKRIQPIQHRERLMYEYSGCNDTMCATKDNLSSDALDKRLQLDSLEEKDIGTLTRIPHTGTSNPEAASDAEIPKGAPPAKRKRVAASGSAAKRAREAPNAKATKKLEKEKLRLKEIDTGSSKQGSIEHKVAGNKPQRKKLKPSPASMPITPEVEVPPKPSSSAVLDPKNVINLDDLPTPTVGSGKSASPSKPPPEEPEATSAEATANDAAKKLTLSGAHELLAKRPSIDEICAKLQVLESEHESLQQSLKESHENETKLKTELEDKHAQEMSEMAEKLKNSNNIVKTLASKLKAAEVEATNIDKLIFPLLGFEWKKDAGVSCVDAYEEAGNSIKDLTEACRNIAQKLSLKKARTTVIDTMTKLMKMVPDLIGDWQDPEATNVKQLLGETRGFDTLFANRVDHSPWYEKHDLPTGFAEDEEEDEEEGSGSGADQSGEGSGDGSTKDNTYHASDDDKPESSE